jgi:membrane protease YdiL (CAAX protease family)
MKSKVHWLYIFEFFILFFVLLLPGYLVQGQPVDPSLFNNVQFNLTYLVSALPQILLILYLILIRPGFKGADSQPRELHPEAFRRFGIVPPNLRSLLRAAISFFGIMAIAYLISLAISLLPEIGGSFGEQLQWEPPSRDILPLILVTALVTGLREELFFRSYMITRFDQANIPTAVTVGASSILFSVGHIYQGLPAFLGTLGIGIFLAVLYVRYREVIPLALAHGLYNFAALLFQGM